MTHGIYIVYNMVTMHDSSSAEILLIGMLSVSIHAFDK